MSNIFNVFDFVAEDATYDESDVFNTVINQVEYTYDPESDVFESHSDMLKAYYSYQYQTDITQYIVWPEWEGEPNDVTEAYRRDLEVYHLIMQEKSWEDGFNSMVQHTLTEKAKKAYRKIQKTKREAEVKLLNELDDIAMDAFDEMDTYLKSRDLTPEEAAEAKERLFKQN